jgi:hypothetical protein
MSALGGYREKHGNEGRQKIGVWSCRADSATRCHRQFATAAAHRKVSPPAASGIVIAAKNEFFNSIGAKQKFILKCYPKLLYGPVTARPKKTQPSSPRRSIQQERHRKLPRTDADNSRWQGQRSSMQAQSTRRPRRREEPPAAGRQTRASGP